MDETAEHTDLELNHQPIELHICKGNILVWNENDVRVLRKTHHIVGALVGSLPRSPRQNMQLGLPLQLMPEEALVLIEYGVAKLVKIQIQKPTLDDALAFEQARENSFAEQQALWEAQSSVRKKQFEHVIALGRTTKKHRRAERAKKLKRKRAERLQGCSDGAQPKSKTAAVDSDCPEDSSIDVALQDASKVPKDEAASAIGTCVSCDDVAEIRNSDRELSTKKPTKCDDLGNDTSEHDNDRRNKVKKTAQGLMESEQITDGRSETDGYEAERVAEDKVASCSTCPRDVVEASRQSVEDRGKGVVGSDEDFKKPMDTEPGSGCLVHLVTASNATPRLDITADWTYPSTQQELLKYRVFKDFWETGYYLTSGCKFGGDFLVYPGDPFLFHSYFIAICVPHGKPVSARDLVMYGRLGTNVKKTIVLCSLDETSDKLVHTSLQWTGFS